MDKMIFILLIMTFGTKGQAQDTQSIPFFAFNNCLEDSQYVTPQQQVELLNSVGFSGMEKNGLEGLEEILKELNSRELRLYTIYLNIDLDNKENPYHPRMEEVFKLLREHKTMPWFYITSDEFEPSSSEHDSVAVPVLRELAAMAETYGLKIMIYPHHNFWVETVEDAIRISEKVDLPNLGFTFNLPHYLANKGTNADEMLEPLVKKAMPHLFAISLNGADEPSREIMRKKYKWNHFIQPLGEGSYNTYEYLQHFVKRGFEGPVGLQCYGIDQDKRAHLGKSMDTWRRYFGKLKNK